MVFVLTLLGDPIQRYCIYIKVFAKRNILQKNKFDCKKNKFACKKNEFDCKNNKLDQKTL